MLNDVNRKGCTRPLPQVEERERLFETFGNVTAAIVEPA